MLRSQTTLAHAFLSLFLERIMHIPQLYDLSIHIKLGPMRKFTSIVQKMTTCPLCTEK